MELIQFITVSNGPLNATFVGMIVTATGVPLNSVVLSVSGNTLTLNNTLPMTLSGVTGGQISSVFPNVIFMFDIYGIPKNDDNKNGDRLPLKSFIPAI